MAELDNVLPSTLFTVLEKQLILNRVRQMMNNILLATLNNLSGHQDIHCVGPVCWDWIKVMDADSLSNAN